MKRRANKGFGLLVVVVAAMAMIAAACGGSSKKSAKGTTVAFAFVGPLTGPNANLGINSRNGAAVAVKQANANQTKYNFVLKDFDTQGDPAQAPGQAAKYEADPQILAVVGPTFSGETKAVLPSLNDAGLVMVSPSATNVQLPNVVPNGKVFHRVIPDDDVQAKGVADYVIAKIKPKTIALIHDNSDYGKGLWEGVLKDLDAAGIKEPVTDAVQPGGTDYSAAVNKVKAGNVDMVFYGGYYSDAGRLKKQLSDAGVKASFISGDGSLDPGFIVSSGAAGGEGALITCPCKLASADAGGALATFANDYQTQWSKAAGTYSSEGFDTANLLIKGVETGNTTRAKLLDYVNTYQNNAYAGISKSIQFETTGNVKTGDVFVYEVKNGKLVLLGSAINLSK